MWYITKKPLFNFLMYFIKNGFKSIVIDNVYDLCIKTANIAYIIDIIIYEPDFSDFLIKKKLINPTIHLKIF